MVAPLRSSHIVLAFAALGVVSGGIAALVWPALIIPGVFSESASSVSWSPAIVFAIALAAGLYLMVTRRIVSIAAMMAASFLGWWVAVELAALASGSLDNSFIGVLHWLASGLAGALVLAVTGAMVGLYDRNIINVAEIAVVGALIVLVSLWWPQDNMWLLLTTWQGAVSAAIAHTIVRSQSGITLAEPRTAAS